MGKKCALVEIVYEVLNMRGVVGCGVTKNDVVWCGVVRCSARCSEWFFERWFKM